MILPGQSSTSISRRCAPSSRISDLADDLWLNRTLRRLGEAVIKEAAH